MAIERKTMSSSALRRRRQAIKKQRAELKRELAAIEAEMASRGRVFLSGSGQAEIPTGVFIPAKRPC